MSPLMIIMLLRYFAHARDYRDEVDVGHARSEAVREAIACFLKWDLVVPTISDDRWIALDPSTRLSQFTLSDRGHAMVDAYKTIKLPIAKWVQP